VDGDVFFAVNKFPAYGGLSGRKLDEMMAGARVDVNDKKRNPLDFVLWKKSKEGEPFWESPWGEGRPGWHIECSAMSMKYLGEQLDIHTGGIDHIAVHHTNEIAQSESATGKKPFTKYWVHHNFLQVEGEKMSKSLDNFWTIDEVIKRGFSPMALRLLFLSTHYRSKMNFTWDSLRASQTAWEKLSRTMGELTGEEQVRQAGELSGLTKQYQQQFLERIGNDLDLPGALTVFWQVVKDKQLLPGEKHQLLLGFDEVLGLGLHQLAEKTTNNRGNSQILLEDLPQTVQDLIKQRAAARDRQDFSLADQLREQLMEKGYSVNDTQQGQIITKA
jgi:cysteinyl-tRNA synthetase